MSSASQTLPGGVPPSPALCRNEEHDQKPEANKKLCLVLDLDHTLLHSVRIADLGPEEEHLLTKVEEGPRDGSSGSSVFKFESLGLITKLRPFVSSFLEEASKMFEMYIYTNGNKTYALEMAKLLDPHGKYFGRRVISRDDSGAGTGSQKRLKVAKVRETDALIVDDKESVWRGHEANLIRIKRYQYFAKRKRSSSSEEDGKSHTVTKRDEAGGVLLVVLILLRQVHCSYLADQASIGSDVRPVLEAVRKGAMMRGCSLDSWAIHVVSRDFAAKRRSRWGTTAGLYAQDGLRLLLAYGNGIEKQPHPRRSGLFLSTGYSV